MSGETTSIITRNRLDAVMTGRLSSETSGSRLSSKLEAGSPLTLERLKLVGDGEVGRAPKLLEARYLAQRDGVTVAGAELGQPKPASTGNPEVDESRVA